MEIGHDRMALDDLAALGGDVASIPLTNPLPTTIGLISFPFYQINYLDPVGYLGYLYFLEYMPTQQGHAYGAALARLGVPEKAMGFLKEHMAADVGHNKLMEQYLRGLVHDRTDVQAIVYAMKVTAQLYSQMLAGAIQHARDPRDYGVASHEARGRAVGAVGTARDEASCLQT
jgi:pyrroloquinoline quinone (PQQ) biosynthesis protein C